MNASVESKPLTILMVDDDEIDRKAAERAFNKALIANSIVFAKDGLDALEVLNGQHKDRIIDGKFLVLLDLNMPRLNGLEFLNEIRHSERLKPTLVFVLTTSKADEDLWAAYRENIAGYISKDNVGRDFSGLIEMLDHYWRMIEFPTNDQKPAIQNANQRS